MSDNLSVERVYFLMIGQATKEKSEIVTVYKSETTRSNKEDYTMALNHIDSV